MAFLNNRENKNNMDPNQTKSKTSAKDFFLNLGAFTALYVLIGNLIVLLFTVIDTAYPKITDYDFFGSMSVSWPVATLIVFFPIFILLMYFLEKEYRVEPDKQDSIIHRGFTYITLFGAGVVIAGDLITVIYYFIDGQELTAGFLLKVLVLLVISSSLFIYYISDLRDKLTPKFRMFWRISSGVIILGSIVWGFIVLGSPWTQRLIKYDEQKVNDLQGINGQIENFYSAKGVLPKNIEEISNGNYHNLPKVDSQTKKLYEYAKTSDTTYNLCAEFNKASDDKNVTNPSESIRFYDYPSWAHPAGQYCFKETINPNMYSKPVSIY